MREVRPAIRGFTAVAGLLLGGAALVTLLGWATQGAVDDVRAPGPAPVGASVALAAAAAAWTVVGWLATTSLLTLLTAVLGGPGSTAHARVLRMTPVAARRVVGVLLGVTLAGTTAAGSLPAVATVRAVAVAAGAPEAADRLPTPPVAGATAGVALDRPVAVAPEGWIPDRPAARHRRSAGDDAAVRLVASVPSAEHGVVDEAVVRRGDTLWQIAARHLGADASVAEIAAEWPRWYAANHRVIGPDPDLLRPGQRLTPPR